MDELTGGTRVQWVGPRPVPRGAPATGTVVDGERDREGLVAVRWDGIGTYRDDPINLSVIDS